MSTEQVKLSESLRTQKIKERQGRSSSDNLRTYSRTKQNKKKEPEIRRDWIVSFIKKIKNKYKNINIVLLCRSFEISRSRIYCKRKADIKEYILKTRIELQHIFDPYYWQRRIAWCLWIDIKTATRIMQKYSLYGKVRIKRRFTKPWDKNLPYMWVENKKKKIVIGQVNQVWSSDFTHLNFKWVEFYLATVLDEYSKKIVWYTIASHHEKEIIFSALEKAIEKEQATPQIQHSDQWSEYRSHSYFSLLGRYNIMASMSKKASPWENWAQESFYWKLKFELGDLNRYGSREEVIEAIHLHIYYYNNHRIHTALKMSPIQFIEQEKELNKNT